MNISSTLLAVILALPLAARAQQMDALQAMEKAASRANVNLKLAVSITGTGGLPDPQSWIVVFHDPSSASKLRVMKVGKGLLEEVPGVENRYLEGEPPVYFSSSRIVLDHAAAFALVEKEATAARIGFDSVDYELRGRDFSAEPVWTLRLVNENAQLVGTVELSAESGKLLRTVWVKRNAATNSVTILDSALTGTVSLREAEPETPQPDPEPLDPTGPLETPSNDAPPALPPFGPKVE